MELANTQKRWDGIHVVVEKYSGDWIVVICPPRSKDGCSHRSLPFSAKDVEKWVGERWFYCDGQKGPYKQGQIESQMIPSKDEAEGIAELVKECLIAKRRRQVRDALNKTMDIGLIEMCAQTLGV